MKKFFEEHGTVAIIVIVIAVLLVLVGSIKGLDESNGKVRGTGIASVVGNSYSKAIDKFQNSFENSSTEKIEVSPVISALGLDQYGITSITQSSDPLLNSSKKGYFPDSDIQYSIDEGTVASYWYPALQILTGKGYSAICGGPFVTMTDYDKDNLNSLLNRGNIWFYDVSNNHIDSSTARTQICNMITSNQIHSLKIATSSANVPIYFENDDTGLSCYLKNNQWTIIDAGTSGLTEKTYQN